MPGKVKVKIIGGRNLPVMDRSSDTTDAYVEIKLGNTTYKTDVCRKSLHPQWNSEWYRFEVDDSELQDEPLQIRLMDHDTYSANDAIGKVYLDLNPLLLPAASLLKCNGDSASKREHAPTPVMSGWIPVYDTMHGIRGEVNITVKVELFSDFNKFRQSSCGVQFFYSPSIPHGYYAQVVHGFVEELVVNDDPEYQWIDKIRPPRVSNEARQTLFFKLSGELQRKVGVKALDLGGNAVIGYNQSFDLEGDSGIVARGIGTAVTLIKMPDTPAQNVNDVNREERALSYLKFLSSDKGFRLNKRPQFLKYNKLFIPRLSPILSNSLSPKVSPEIQADLDHQTKNFTRHLSRTDFAHEPTSTIQHSTSLQTLLKQEDMRGTPGSGISQRIKNLKYSSQNLLSKKMTALKAKLSDSGTPGESGDNFDGKKKKSNNKRPKSESSTMAEVLVRSVMLAHSSLDCIVETHNSPPILKKQMSLNDSFTNSTEPLNKSAAASYLSLPGTSMDTHSSNVSESSESSSSDGEISDTQDDRIDCDTVSALVKNVRRLSMLNRTDLPENNSFRSISTLEEQVEVESIDESDDFFLKNSNDDEDGKNYSFLDGKETENVPTDIQSKGDTLLELDVDSSESPVKTKGHTVVFVVGDESVPPIAEMDDFSICSGSDETNAGANLESTKSSYSEELPIASTNVRDKQLIIPPVMMGASIGNQGLIKTAMQTILLDKVNIMGTYTPPTSPTIASKVEFFNIPSKYTPVIHETDQSFLPQITKTFETVRTSSTSTSFSDDIHNSDYLGSKCASLSNLSCRGDENRRSISSLPDKNSRKYEHVLNAPFISVGSRDAESASQSNNVRSSSVVHALKENGPQHFASFDDLHIKTIKHHTFLSKAESKIKNVFVAPLSLFHNLHEHGKKKAEDGSRSQRGLLGTALENVLIESVNDILAMSKGKANSSETNDPQVEPLGLVKTETFSGAGKSGREQKLAKEQVQVSSEVDDRIAVDSGEKMNEDGVNRRDGGATHLYLESLGGDEKHLSGDEAADVSFNQKKVVEGDGENQMEGGQRVDLPPDVTKTGSELLATKILNDQVEDEMDILVSFPRPDDPNSITSNTVPPPNKNFTLSVPANVQIEQGTNANQMHASLHPSLRTNGSPLDLGRNECGHQRTESMGAKVLHSPAKVSAIPCIHRRSSDSDLSITPKGNSLTGSDRSSGAVSGHFMRNNTILRPVVPQDNFDILEYPFLTMSKYPPGFIAYLGGAVSARSVKLLERITNIEEPESRDTWWSEIRMEIRSHARAYNCNSILGYSETTSICDDVCVLSASGTAAIIGYQYSGESSDNLGGLPIIPKTNVLGKDVMSMSLDRGDFDKEKRPTDSVPIAQNNSNNNNNLSESPERETTTVFNITPSSNIQSCVMCHLPYNGSSASLRSRIYKCAVCRVGKVPELLIATIEMPEGIPCVGRGCFLQSFVSRPLKDLKGESYAKEISDGLPFLEYELHRILVNKLKVKGMNAIFGLKLRISIGEKMLIGIATGTAVFLSSLPSPPLPKLVCDRTTDVSKLAELQKQLHETIKKNKETYQLKVDFEQNGKSDTDDSEDEQTVLDLGVGNKDCCILEVDDPEDVEILNLLMELRPPDGFHVVNTELVPGLQELEIVKNLQMFIQIWRAKIHPPHYLDKHFQRLLETVYFKLRRMIPCALCDLQFRVDSPEPDEIQLCVLGMALGLGDPQKNTKLKRKTGLSKRNEEELIFNLEEDQIPENSVVQTPPSLIYLQTHLSKYRQKSPQRSKTLMKQRHVPYRERHGVDITPLSYVPGGKIERYLGNLNFFFIRETTSVREEGGFSAFIHSFVTEVLAIIRAHVTALGGNAMVAYFMTECVLNQNIHKNQGQCLINVGGDVVYVSYFSEDQ